MIYITGDTHGEQGRFLELNMYGESQWTDKDILIVCGDFGYLFTNQAYEHAFLNSLEKKPYTICFCDGNHENFPAIKEYPRVKWNGGYVHKIRENVLHLTRGQVFNLQGKTFFVMGGGYSIDRYMRKEGYSYWKEEMPNNEEYREATKNLREAGFKVDYIISHTAPQTVVRMMGKYCDSHELELNGFFDWVAGEVAFKRWFFGHWHADRLIGGKFRAVWFDVIPLEN